MLENVYNKKIINKKIAVDSSQSIFSSFTEKCILQFKRYLKIKHFFLPTELYFLGNFWSAGDSG